MAQLVASMSVVVLGGAVEVVGSNLARGKIFTPSIGSVDSLYPSVYIYNIYIYSNNYEAGYDSLFIMYLKILWKMEHLLQKSKCSIFPNIFKSIQNLTYLFPEFFNVV